MNMLTTQSSGDKNQTIHLLAIFTLAIAFIFLLLIKPSLSQASAVWDSADFSAGVHTSTAANGAVTLDAEVVKKDEAGSGLNFGFTQVDTLRMTQFVAGGEVAINEGYTYSVSSIPGLVNNEVNHAFFEGDLLYISTFNGLSVIDTKGTPDPSDDTLVTRYHTESSPALANQYVYQAFLAGDLLYVATDDGLSVIDTKGTSNPSDDVLVNRYHGGGSPALVGNNSRIYHAFIAGDLLYIGTEGGLTVIDTKGTPESDDDTLVAYYFAGDASNPVLSSETINHTFLAGDFLYLATEDGLSVIDTKGTPDPVDDTLVTRYHRGSSPALEDNVVLHSFLAGDLLYISTMSGLSVIDTKGTSDPVDDTLVTRYHKGSNPALEDNIVLHAFLAGDLLYISTSNGLTVIETNGTSSSDDDTLAAYYHKNSSPALAGSFVNYAFLDRGNLYAVTIGGLSVVTPGRYYSSGEYRGLPHDVQENPVRSLSFASTMQAEHSVHMSYRAGNETVIWRDDFFSTDSFLDDIYDWNSDFSAIVPAAEDGVLRVVDNADSFGGWNFWIGNFDFEDDHFPLGSEVTARVRFSGLEPGQEYEVEMFNDDWWDYDYVVKDTDDWFTLSFTAVNKSFSAVGFSVFSFNESSPNLAFEIDYIQIIAPESAGGWEPWKDCPQQLCVLSDLGAAKYLQYKLDLATADTATTPHLQAVTFYGDYFASGTYTSTAKVISGTQLPVRFVVDATIPEDTAASFSYSVDDGETWLPVTPGEVFPGGAIADSVRWRADMTSSNPASSPVIRKVTFAPITPDVPRNTPGNATRIDRSRFPIKLPPPAQAPTVAEQFSEIQNLLSQFQPLLAQMQTGRVLGISDFNFHKNLFFGMRDDDVRELQARLRAAGYFTFPQNTGYFGPITLEAVKVYQTANGIPNTGFVGPLTRAALNK